MKLVSLVNRPLGLGNVYSPTKKEWIPAVIGAVGAIGSALIGGSMSQSAADRAARKQEEWYNKEYARELRRGNESILDTKRGQNLLRMAKEHAKDQWKKAAGAQAVSGGTASATQMAKDAGNKMVADAAANLAVMDDKRQERADERISALNAKKAQYDIAYEQNKANNVAAVASAASNAIAQGASAFAADTSLKGGSNMGTPVAKSTDTGYAKVGDNTIKVGDTGNSYTDQMSKLKDIEDAYNKANATQLYR